MFLLLLLPIIIHLAFFFSYLVPVPLLQFSLLTQITEFVYSVSSSLSSLDWFLFWKSLWFIGWVVVGFVFFFCFSFFVATFGSGMNLITTVIGFGMSITFIVFVCTRLICGRVRDAEEQLEVGVEFRSERDHSANGLEPVVVAAFPTMKFSSDAFPSSEDGQCSICLGEYEEKEILRIMPSCGHNFHLLCIDTWLQKHSTCPVCRLSLHDSFEAKHVTSPAFIRTNQSVNNSSEVMNDSSNQWLLPARDRSSSSGSSHELHGSAPQNLETRIHVGEVWPVR